MSMNLWKIEQLCKENFALGAASRDAEVTELKAENESLLKNLRGKHALTGATYAHLIKERDQLRDQVNMLRDALLTWGDKDTPLGVRIDTMVKALAATEPKEE